MKNWSCLLVSSSLRSWRDILSQDYLNIREYDGFGSECAATGMGTSNFDWSFHSRSKQRSNHRFNPACLNNPAIKISRKLRMLVSSKEVSQLSSGSLNTGTSQLHLRTMIGTADGSWNDCIGNGNGIISHTVSWWFTILWVLNSLWFGFEFSAWKIDHLSHILFTNSECRDSSTSHSVVTA